jgi:glycosyltransferase involved in cell wall biosynthesis
LRVSRQQRQHQQQGFSNQAIHQRYSHEGAVIAANLDSKWPLSARFKACSIRTYRQINSLLLIPPDPKYDPHCNIGMVSTWPPRKCGIATFSSHLRQSLLLSQSTHCQPNKSRVDIIAVDGDSDVYDPLIVKHLFHHHESIEYLSTAKWINSQRYQTLFIQVEFGLYDMDNFLCLLREIKIHQLFLILHTVHVNLLEIEHSWIQQMTFLSTKIIVLSHTMRYILEVYHGIPSRDVLVIPHGGIGMGEWMMRIEEEERDTDMEHTSFQRYDTLITSINTSQPPPVSITLLPIFSLLPSDIVSGKKLILSNGLIHPFKGFQYMIRAMPHILSVIPNALYVISGIPHPTGGVGCKDYYNSLVQEATDSGLTINQNIYFDQNYRTDDELSILLRSTHLYVNPYTNIGQSVSGTLTMALSVGTITISTPYPYAREMLRNDVGKLIPFHSVEQLAETVIEILNQTNTWHELKTKEIYERSQEFSWKEIGKRYSELLLS